MEKAHAQRGDRDNQSESSEPTEGGGLPRKGKIGLAIDAVAFAKVHLRRNRGVMERLKNL